MPSKPTGRGDRRSPSTTPTRHPPAPHSTTSRSAILRRLHSNHETTSTLQSSAIAAMSTLSPSTPGSPATSLHALAPNRAIKVVLIGDTGSGKTSLRHRFLTNQFFPSYRATIGADFITRTLPIDPLHPDGEKATLQIWDTAGQERFQSLGSAFYRGADAVVIAFDASSEGGIERVRDWVRVFLDKGDGLDGEERGRFCWVCAANKVDLAGVDRQAVWEVLDACVGRREGQPDVGLGGEGAGEPADPGEVLSRPDPNGADSTPGDAGSREEGDASPTLASKSAKATNDTQPNGGTVKTLYATPFNTLSQAAQLSSSPTAVSSKQESGSGFLSRWRRRSKPPPGNGHAKRQSIRSIEVFQSDESDSEPSTGFAFPSSSKTGRTGAAQDTPPRGVQSGSKGGERRRMDSTLSTHAPSVYHTPRGSTVLSASPSLTSTLTSTGESSRREDSTHRAADEPSRRGSSTHLTPTAESKRTSMASSTLTIRPPKSIDDLFNPSSPVAPHTSSSPPAPLTLSSPLPPRTPSTISIPAEPAPPAAATSELEHGFTLFETSARTGQNVERLFAHVVQRVVAHQAWQAAQRDADETPEERAERTRRDDELMRRTIRLASGKATERRFGCC